MGHRTRDRHDGKWPRKLDHAILFSGDSDFRRLVEGRAAPGACACPVVSTVSQQPADDRGTNCAGRPTNFLELSEIAPGFTRRADGARATRSHPRHTG